jgi:hypothetical protein
LPDCPDSILGATPGGVKGTSRSARPEARTLTHDTHGVLTLAIWLLATVSFAGLSAILYPHGLATIAPAQALQAPLWDSAVNFYVRRSLDSIPVLEIPEMIGWTPAFRFTDHVSPILLLLYKIVVILPLIETGRLIWQQRQTRAFA